MLKIINDVVAVSRIACPELFYFSYTTAICQQWNIFNLFVNFTFSWTHVPVIAYVMAAVNSHSFISLLFISFLILVRQKKSETGKVQSPASFWVKSQQVLKSSYKSMWIVCYCRNDTENLTVLRCVRWAELSSHNRWFVNVG